MSIYYGVNEFWSQVGLFVSQRISQLSIKDLGELRSSLSAVYESVILAEGVNARLLSHFVYCPGNESMTGKEAGFLGAHITNMTGFKTFLSRLEGDVLGCMSSRHKDKQEIDFPEPSFEIGGSNILAIEQFWINVHLLTLEGIGESSIDDLIHFNRALNVVSSAAHGAEVVTGEILGKGKFWPRREKLSTEDVFFMGSGLANMTELRSFLAHVEEAITLKGWIESTGERDIDFAATPSHVPTSTQGGV